VKNPVLSEKSSFEWKIRFWVTWQRFPLTGCWELSTSWLVPNLFSRLNLRESQFRDSRSQYSRYSPFRFNYLFSSFLFIQLEQIQCKLLRMSILCVTLFEDVCNLRFIKKKITFLIQCPPLNRITLGQHKSDNNNRMIQLTDVFCVLFRYITGSLLSDYNKRLIQLSMIQLSGGHCIVKLELTTTSE